MIYLCGHITLHEIESIATQDHTEALSRHILPILSHCIRLDLRRR
jgi:hypothetical protein